MELGNMSYDEKQELAEDLKTPNDVLRKLAKKDEHWAVRRYVAENPNTPGDVLTELTIDPQDFVRVHVAQNPNSSSNILVTLLENEKNCNTPNLGIIKSLYIHKNLPHIAKVIIETLFGKWL